MLRSKNLKLDTETARFAAAFLGIAVCCIINNRFLLVRNLSTQRTALSYAAMKTMHFIGCAAGLIAIGLFVITVTELFVFMIKENSGLIRGREEGMILSVPGRIAALTYAAAMFFAVSDSLRTLALPAQGGVRTAIDALFRFEANHMVVFGFVLLIYTTVKALLIWAEWREDVNRTLSEKN